MEQGIKTEAKIRYLDRDRYVDPDKFMEFLKTFDEYHWFRVLMITMTITARRPCELLGAKISALKKVDDKYQLTLKLGKPSISKRDDKGRVKKVTYNIKVKCLDIPCWLGDYIQGYIDRRFTKYAIEQNAYLFGNIKEPWKKMDRRRVTDAIYRQRKLLYKKDPEKWAWLFDSWEKIVKTDGKIQRNYCLSTYTPRKIGGTHFRKECIRRGVGDPIIELRKFLGHAPSSRHTFAYPQGLVDEGDVINSIAKKFR